jgi:voltage-gated potassium channel
MPSPDELSRSQRRRAATMTLLRSALVTTAMVFIYFLLPLDQAIGPALLIEFALALVLFGILMVWQVRAVLRSTAPRLRAVQAMAVGIPFLVLLFAAIHTVIGNAQPLSYTEPLTRTDALYFTITVFATVGFGDIAPVSQVARVVTTVQMVVGVMVVGLVVRVMLGAVQEAMRRRATTDDD